MKSDPELGWEDGPGEQGLQKGLGAEPRAIVSLMVTQSLGLETGRALSQGPCGLWSRKEKSRSGL